MQHSGVEFEVIEAAPRRWRWIIYPKKWLGAAKVAREVIAKDRRDAVARAFSEWPALRNKPHTAVA